MVKRRWEIWFLPTKNKPMSSVISVSLALRVVLTFLMFGFFVAQSHAQSGSPVGPQAVALRAAEPI
jgi:hypothetical protein